MANSVIDRVLEFLEVEEIKAYKLEDDGLGVCMELEDISVEMMLYYDENQRMVTIDSIDFLEIPQSKYDDIYKLINEFNFKDMFNKYVLDTTGLKVLDLNGKDYCILHWISILLKNRKFTIDNEFGNAAREYILKNFPVDVSGYDIIKGYRADDSYFSYAKDFLQNGISVRRLAQVMKLGDLGNQIVLVVIIKKCVYLQNQAFDYEKYSLSLSDFLKPDYGCSDFVRKS